RAAPVPEPPVRPAVRARARAQPRQSRRPGRRRRVLEEREALAQPRPQRPLTQAGRRRRRRPGVPQTTPPMHPDDDKPGRFRAGAAPWVGAALLVACLVLAAHSWRTSAGTAILLSACAAFVAYAGSRRAFDAAVLALPPLAGWWVDADVGPPAFLAACLVPWLLTRRPLFAAVTGSAFAALLPASIGLKERFAGTPL